MEIVKGELAQLARALRLHRRGHRFDSDILHKFMRKLCVLCAFLCVNFALNAQVINYVEYKHQSDIKVYFVDWKHQADIVINFVKSPYFAKTNPGFWYLNPFDLGGVKVYRCKWKHEADVKVFITGWKYQVRINEKYLNLIQ